MQTLTYDKIAGITAPLGKITGFPKPHVRSPWPTCATACKLLTDKRIAFYQARGYYNGIPLDPKTKPKKHESGPARMARLLRKYK
jgi:hypothetical protein